MRYFLQPFEVRPHQLGAERAVHADREHREVRDRVPERFDFLAGDERGPAFVERARDHHRHADALLVEVFLDGEQARLEVERVDDRFGEQDIDARFDERGDLLVVRVDHLVERDAAVSWRRRRLVLMAVCFVVGPIEPATNRGRSGVLLGEFIAGPAGTCDGRRVDFADELVRQVKLFHADRAGAERVRLDDVGAGGQIAAMDVGDRRRDA